MYYTIRTSNVRDVHELMRLSSGMLNGLVLGSIGEAKKCEIIRHLVEALGTVHEKNKEYYDKDNGWEEAMENSANGYGCSLISHN